LKILSLNYIKKKLYFYFQQLSFEKKGSYSSEIQKNSMRTDKYFDSEFELSLIKRKFFDVFNNTYIMEKTKKLAGILGSNKSANGYKDGLLSKDLDVGIMVDKILLSNAKKKINIYNIEKNIAFYESEDNIRTSVDNLISEKINNEGSVMRN